MYLFKKQGIIFFQFLLILSCFISYASKTVAQSQVHDISALPGLYAGARFGDELLPGLKHQQNDALPDTKATEGEYTSERLPESRSQPGFLRLSSPYTLNVDADSLQPAKGTACVTEALDSGQRKKWQCYSKQGGHHSVTVDIAVSHVDKSVILLPANQDMTVQYLSLSEGEITASPQFEFHQSDIAKAALKQSLQNKKKIDEAVQKASAMIKISTRSKDDDPSIKAIRFKLLNDISREDGQMLQETIKNIRLGDRPEILKNTDDMFLLPDTTLQLSSHGLQFAGKISNLAGGKDGGAKSNNKNTKPNEKSSGKQPSASSGAGSSGASSYTSAEYKFKFSERCPYCQNQRSEKNLGTDKHFELIESNFKQVALSDDEIIESDPIKLIKSIEEDDRSYVESYLHKFPDRIVVPVEGEFFREDTLLNIAIYKKRPEMVKLLLEAEALYNKISEPDSIKLIKAIENDARLYVESYLNKFPDHIKVPVKCGFFEVDASLLELAILKKKPAIVELLLKKGADLNQTENLMLVACKWTDRGDKKDNLEIIHHLLRFGADPDAYQEGSWLETTLSLCIENNSEEAFNLLLTHGANPNPSESLTDDSQTNICKFYLSNKNLTFLEILLEHGFNLNRCYQGLYPIHIALIEPDFWTLERVKKLAGSADVNIKTEDGGATPLHLAVSSLSHTLDIKEIVICLMSHGADPEITGRLPKSCNIDRMHIKACKAFKEEKSITALELAEPHVREIIISQQGAQRRLQAMRLNAARGTATGSFASGAGDSSGADSKPGDIPTKASRLPSLLKVLAQKFRFTSLAVPELSPEPSAPPPEDYLPSEENRSASVTESYGVAPPPYSEEDPNPSPYPEK